MSKSFKIELNPEANTFTELKNKKYPWWDNLKKNKDISIQIRKDNTIDVYYNGGAILRGLKYDEQKKVFKAEIHPKYIPLKDENNYKSLTLSSNGVEFTGEIAKLDHLEDAILKAITERIKKYFDSESEKAIQYEFAKNDSYIIDTEFQHNESRIDLIRLDDTVKKIVLIEVKTMGDPRLYIESKKNKDDKENIYDQLKKYKEFAENYSESIHEYYKKVLKIKNDLGITKGGVSKLSINEWEVERKPLLIFGDCKQKWISNNKDDINNKIKDVAYGVYYYGSTKSSLALKQKKHDNRCIY